MNLGQTITKIRKERGLTQEEFAKEFNVTRQTISNWENSKSYPDLLTLVKISEDYGYSLDSMLKDDKDMTVAINRCIQMGRQLRERSKLTYVCMIIGSIGCIILGISSLLEADKITSDFLWFALAIFNVVTLIKLIKQNKNVDNLENSVNTTQLSSKDVATIKQLNEYNMTSAAVKMIRIITGLGLYEAKVLFDEITKEES